MIKKFLALALLLVLTTSGSFEQDLRDTKAIKEFVASQIDAVKAKSLSDKYLSHVLSEDYDQLYLMMDPVLKKDSQKSRFEKHSFATCETIW